MVQLGFDHRASFEMPIRSISFRPSDSSVLQVYELYKCRLVGASIDENPYTKNSIAGRLSMTIKESVLVRSVL